jgi:single-strand DNA-binding protein
MNKFMAIGRLTSDPESKTLKDDLVTTTFSIAVEREGSKEVDFLDIVTWRKTAENCAKFLSKGSLVFVEGRVQKRSYENKEGKKVYVTDIIADKVKFLNKVEKKQTEEEDYF